MGILRKRVCLAGARGDRRLEVLIDDASSECLISPELARELGRPEELGEPVIFHTARRGVKLEAREGVFLCVRQNSQSHWGQFFVVDRGDDEAVIGAAFLQHHDCTISYRRRDGKRKADLRFGDCCSKLRV